MLFEIIRVIFGVILFIVCYSIIKASKIQYKRRSYLISLICAILIIVFSNLLPIENAFITFSTPESAFSYVNTGNIKLVIDGSQTDFVVAEKGDAKIYSIIPKTENGWKLGMGKDTKKINQKSFDGIVIYVYQYKNTNDYYITVLNTNGGMLELSDNYNSTFYHLDQVNKELNETFYTYYAYIEALNEQYALSINGNKIILSTS